jgi:protein-L-isoaspartate(D-aspartate) O-methyltransferase
MVALMTESLGLVGGERVLEIGTGSGYQAAILSRIAGKVFTVELHAELSSRARAVCRELGYTNVYFRVVAATDILGWAEEAPFDGIVVTAGAHRVPEALLDELADGARLVVPVGTEEAQELTIVHRKDSAFHRTIGTACRFVPLIGEDGWPEPRDTNPPAFLP